MRPRDEAKKDALYSATIQVVNEEGFAAASVNKIAKRAGISPGTLYIYFSNKEDLLVSTFLTVKSQLSEYTLSDFSSNNTLKENVRNFWLRLYEFVRQTRMITNISISFLIHLSFNGLIQRNLNNLMPNFTRRYSMVLNKE